MKDRPGIIAPPPFVFLVIFAAGWFGRDLLPRYHAEKTAVVVAVAGILLFAWALFVMLRAGTHIDPYQPSTTVVTTGPFRFTRNPLYLSMNLLYVAVALASGSLASLVLLPVANVLLHYGVIRREERYLDAKFGEIYRAYRSRVRRWL